jgi:nitrogen fixation NifU-like protein
MSDLRELYQEVILDHTKKPRNFGKLEHASSSAQGFNPLCGDSVTVHLSVEDGRVVDVRFEGKGCAISTASASLMTEAIKGRDVDEVKQLFERFHDVVTGPPDVEPDLEALGKLAVLAGVREFPMRVKCASLAWHTMVSALTGEAQPVTTE